MPNLQVCWGPLSVIKCHMFVSNFENVFHPQRQTCSCFSADHCELNGAFPARLKKMLKKILFAMSLSTQAVKEPQITPDRTLCGSVLVAPTLGVLQGEIRHPAPPSTSCPMGPLYHCSQISISPAGCLEIPGERKKNWCLPGSPYTFEVFYLISISSY